MTGGLSAADIEFIAALERCGTARPGPYDDPCHDCGAKPGEPHSAGCDVAICQETGEQRIACDEDHDHGCGSDIWTGRWPGFVECEEFGWWERKGDAGWERCEPGAPGAHHDLTRLHHEAQWDRDAKRWVKWR